MSAYDDNPDVVGDYVWIKAERAESDRERGTQGGRRVRAGQITAHKRAYEREHGVTLTRLTQNYSETYGFMSQTSIRYKIDRTPRGNRSRGTR